MDKRACRRDIRWMEGFMIVYSDKFIFYHVPKTGGMWVSENLPKIVMNTTYTNDPPYCKVSPYNKAHSVPTMKPLNLYSFCFFRNPFEWYKSLWRYKNTHQSWSNLREKGEYLYEIGANDSDFNRFLKKLFKVHPEGFCTTIFRQYEGLDFIGKQENLIEDLKTALENAGEEFDLRKLSKPTNVSDKTLVAEYTKENKEMVANADKYIFDNYYD